MRKARTKRTAIVAGTLVLAIGLALLASITYYAAKGYAQRVTLEPQFLESESLTVVTGQGRFDLTVEVADEPNEQAIGLMFREEMETDHGMLFDFGETRPVSMWMKNTPLSLDMIFIRKDGTVANIAERTVPFSVETVSSSEPVAFVLEIKGGVARMMGLKPGDRLEHRLFE